MQSKDAPRVYDLLKPIESSGKVSVQDTADSYLDYFEKGKDGKERKNETASSVEMTRQYYDLCTDFYEYGWGESFHFAPFREGESKELAFAKHEYYLALKLKLDCGDEVLDCGCGIGGPARKISEFSGAKITGINLNEYQLQRANALTEKQCLQHLLHFQKEDFNKMSFADATFDKVYAIEATCHAPDVRRVYSEIFRVLKPGGLFAAYEWGKTSLFQPENKQHQKIIDDVLVGNGLPELRTLSEVNKALEDVGFKILQTCNQADVDPKDKARVPWYDVFNSKSKFKISSPSMRYMTHLSLSALEMVGMAPKGSVKVHKTLCQGADGLYAAGKEGIFTPMYFFLVQKPTE